MIEIFISDTDATSGSVPITWCVSPETLKLLAEQEVRDPQIVICVAPAGEKYAREKEVRKVVALKDLMTYIEFRSSGKNNIWAVVSFRDPKSAKNLYLSKKDGAYDSSMLSYDGTDYSGWLKKTDSQYRDEEAIAQAELEKTHMLSTPVTVNVPVECFAKEPSAWEKTWVNHFFRAKSVDQCDFRRRRLFAYLVQPLVLLAF